MKPVVIKFKLTAKQFDAGSGSNFYLTIFDNYKKLETNYHMTLLDVIWPSGPKMETN